MEVDILLELCEEMGLWPSKYQRPNMLLEGLRAQPIWTPEAGGIFALELKYLELLFRFIYFLSAFISKDIFP